MLCCKVMGVLELDKPPVTWCSHCSVGKGCAIYSARPASCAAFACAWLKEERWGPEWKPEKAKFILMADNARGWLFVHLDTAAPHAWKRPPYRENLNAFMRAGLPKGGRVFLKLRENFTLLLPDGEHPIGELADGDLIEVAMAKKPDGEEYKVAVRKKSDSGAAVQPGWMGGSVRG